MLGKPLIAAAAAVILHFPVALGAGLAVNSDGVAAIPANPEREAYFGDLHLHTSYSFDAYVLYGTQVTPEQAYQFARGDSIDYQGHQVKRPWPLDFMAVTDHAENIGVLNNVKNETGPGYRQPGKSLREIFFALFSSKTPITGIDAQALAASAWEREIRAANSYNQPGKFTTFIGYEWTAKADEKTPIHRNVIFRGDNAPIPFSALDSANPEDLWAYLEVNRKRGFEAFAIPHNANLSNGLMYDWNSNDGRPIDQAYALRRAMNEPLSEISQIKGQSETHPALSAADEFAGFELLDRVTADGHHREVHGSYIRDAYGRGLVLGHNVGANPYKFGVVGGSDLHNGLSSSDEGTYGGVEGGADPAYATSADDMRKIIRSYQDTKLYDFDVEGGTFNAYDITTGSAGLTGVWAERNTRESIYDALRRKETFATSGPRVKVRFFGGWSYASNLLRRSDWIKQAYAGGVPMGSDLPSRSSQA